jgi:hypothetical protein
MYSIFTTKTDLLDFNPLTDKCIYIDLDETMVHTSDNENPTESNWIQNTKIFKDPRALVLRDRVYNFVLDDVVDEKGTGQVYNIYGILRPHAREFILFAFMYFKIVCVWSAGKKKYVQEIIRFLFDSTREPNLIFSYEHCKQDKNRIEKPINFMFSIPEMSKYMNVTNTIGIDDRHDTFSEVNPDNAIVIPAFRPTFTLNGLLKEDNALVQIMSWLCSDTVIKSTDIRTLDKTKIFKYDVDVLLDFDYILAILETRKNFNNVNKLTPVENSQFLQIYQDLLM